MQSCEIKSFSKKVLNTILKGFLFFAFIYNMEKLQSHLAITLHYFIIHQW